jgi:hypothetical protein
MGSRMASHSEDVQVMNGNLTFPDTRLSLLISLFLCSFKDALSDDEVIYGKTRNDSV